MDKRRFEIIYHLLIFAYFFGDSDLLLDGGANINFYGSDYISIHEIKKPRVTPSLPAST